jgi:hypothetical protein
MNKALIELANHLAMSYSLGYLPTNTAHDGKRRRIKVELAPAVEKREGKTALISRRSYIMPKEAN